MRLIYEITPGVPGAGHISGGFWHPGSPAGCAKGACAVQAAFINLPRQRQRQLVADAVIALEAAHVNAGGDPAVFEPEPLAILDHLKLPKSRVEVELVRRTLADIRPALEEGDVR